MAQLNLYTPDVYRLLSFFHFSAVAFYLMNEVQQYLRYVHVIIRA